MASCPACGKDLQGEFAFCPYCGAAVAAAPAVAREQRKVVTVLFCDVTGSTELGEQLDPETLRALLARYFERMKEIIERHGGSVEKFIGDAVMAVFGVPVVHEDDALRTVRAAVEMRDAFAELGVQGRIGVTTGEVVTGTEERLATGDAVNVAARLEQAAQPGEILIGEGTFGLTRDAAVVEEVAPLLLKGKSEPVTAYRLLAVHAGEVIARQLDTPMVGRETELRRLHDAYDQATQNCSSQLFTVLGPAGVGKSRLAFEFLNDLEGALVVRGRCLPYGEGITYWPVVEVVKQLPASSRGEDVLAAVVGEGATSSAEIAWGFRSLLEAVAAERPLVVVFDDVHWGEETFLDLVEHVADLSRGAPILLLCMARSELLDRRPGWAGGKVNATSVLLESLAPEEADAMIDSLASLEPALRERIRDAAEGNPLFVEEMVSLVKESGNGDITVPPTIQALLAARLDQLEPSERGVLERGSVEGRVFHRGAVEALAPDEPGLMDRLTSLVRKELVRPDKPQLAGEDAFRFRHLLIRDAAYDALPKATRAELHERFAAWLGEQGTDLVELDEILGYHLEQAHLYRVQLGSADGERSELPSRAAEHLATAARRAFARGDMPGAAGLFARAVALLPAGDPARVRLLPVLGRTLVETGDWDGARSVLTEASTARTAAGERAAVAEAAVELIFLDLHTDPHTNHARVKTELYQQIAVFEELGHKPGLAHALDLAGMLHVWSGQAHAGIEELELAGHYASESGNRFELVHALSGLVSTLVYGPTPVSEALEKLEDISRQGEGALMLETRILRAKARLVAMQGDFMKARELIGQADTLAQGLGLEILRAGGILRYAGEIELLAGDYAAAERMLRSACQVLESKRDWGHFASVAPLLALGLIAQDRTDEAVTFIEAARAHTIADDVEAQILQLRGGSKLAAHRGSSAEAEALARQASVRASQNDDPDVYATTLVELADALERLGRGEEAAAALEQAFQLFEQKGNLVMAERVRGRLADR